MWDLLPDTCPLILRGGYLLTADEKGYFLSSFMSKIRQIDYATPRTLVSYSGKRQVRLTGEDSRYKFSGILVAGAEDEIAKIGEERKDWQKSAFPLPWTDSPDVVFPDEA